jgi:dephospho-CoA kinase
MFNENKSTLIIGLTGSFGSGCSTLAKALKELGFKYFSLSDIVKEEWQNKNKNKNVDSAPRYQLQEIGNNLRKRYGYDFLAKETSNRANQTVKGKEELIVFDSIRNTAEIRWLRNNNPNFYLIAVDCSRPIRWGRIKQEKYYEHKNKSTEIDFIKDDEIDRDQEELFGQQVQLCVYEADIVINNNNDYSNEKAAIKRLKDKVNKLLLERISENEDLKVPNNDEFCMSMAYCASLKSKCIKRQVGAVIVDTKNVIVSPSFPLKN